MEKYKSTGSDLDYFIYTKHRNQLRSLTRKSFFGYEQSLIKTVATNPKEFWKYAKRKLKTKTELKDLVDSNGKSCNVDKEKADIKRYKKKNHQRVCRRKHREHTRHRQHNYTTMVIN